MSEFIMKTQGLDSEVAHKAAEEIMRRLPDNLYHICGSDTVIGICMDKSQKNTGGQFRRLERQQLGKRRFEILKKVE